jgi:hypothetical protein
VVTGPSSIRLEADRHFRNKKREYLKDKIDELATNSKNKNIRDLYGGINEFKRGYQPSNNLVKDENGDLLGRFPRHFEYVEDYAQLLNVHRVSDVRQKYIQLSHKYLILALLKLNCYKVEKI